MSKDFCEACVARVTLPGSATKFSNYKMLSKSKRGRWESIQIVSL